MDSPTASAGGHDPQHQALQSSAASSETAHDVDLERDGAATGTPPTAAVTAAAAAAAARILHDEKQSGYVTWSGPDDPDHPQNWPLRTKLRVSLLLTCITLGVSVGSSIFGPGAQEFEQEYGVGSEVAVLGTSLYLLGFVFGPPFWGPVSEKFGRKVPMLLGLAIGCVWTVMTAVGQNATTVIMGRFLTGVFGAAPVAIIGGAATDNWGPVARGINLTVVVGTTFGGPLLGPIIGNYVVQAGLGWRWNLWIMAIFTGAVSLVCVVALPELYPPSVLKQKTKRLRKETGDPSIKCRFDDETMNISHICRVYLVRPWVLFFTEPILVLVSIFQAFVYGIVYLFLSAYPIVFREQRGWAAGLSGLPLLSLNVGIGLAVGITVVYTRTTFARKVATHHGTVEPEDRLPLMIGGAVLIPLGLFWFAWTAAPDIPWPSVVVAGVVVGTGMFLVFITCITYLIDVYLHVCNSAMASNSMVRALFGAGFPLFASQMYHRLGTAWATSVLAFVSMAMIPVPIVFYVYGPRIRRWSKNTIQGD